MKKGINLVELLNNAVEFVKIKEFDKAMYIVVNLQQKKQICNKKFTITLLFVTQIRDNDGNSS